jgi:hypothetical protein
MNESGCGKPIRQRESGETIVLVNKTQKNLKFKESWPIVLNNSIPQG